jgi:hypothetical protein
MRWSDFWQCFYRRGSEQISAHGLSGFVLAGMFVAGISAWFLLKAVLSLLPSAALESPCFGVGPRFAHHIRGFFFALIAAINP